MEEVFSAHGAFSAKCRSNLNRKTCSSPFLGVLRSCSFPESMFLVSVSSVSLQRRIRCFRATGENKHVSEVSLELGPKVPLPKTEKSADLAHYFSGVATFCVLKKSQHRA